MSGLPIPKFSIGDTLWWPSVVDDKEYSICPDCLGAGVWPVTSPAGEAHEVACPTCKSCGWGSSTGKLSRLKFSPSAWKLTVGAIQINTAHKESYENGPVRYMCYETGIGSGSLYDEKRCFPDESAALAFAAAEADQKTKSFYETEDQKKRAELRVLPISTKEAKEFRDRAIKAEIALQTLKQAIVELPDNGWQFAPGASSHLRDIAKSLIEEDDPAWEGVDA